MKAGRNDPCPCGSGKKFKKCHGDDSAPSPEKEVKRLIDMDHRLMSAIADFGVKRFANKNWDPFFLEPPHDHDDHDHDEDCDHDVLFADVSFPIAMYSDVVEGKTVAAHYAEHMGTYLGAEDKGWLDAQQAAAFGVYQLSGLAGDGARVTITDRLANKTIEVVDTDLAKNGEKNEVFFARIVSFNGAAVLTAMHREMVAPESAEELVASIKAAPHATQRELVEAWQNAVYEEEADEDDAGDDEDDDTAVPA